MPGFKKKETNTFVIHTDLSIEDGVHLYMELSRIVHNVPHAETEQITLPTSNVYVVEFKHSKDAALFITYLSESNIKLVPQKMSGIISIPHRIK